MDQGAPTLPNKNKNAAIHFKEGAKVEAKDHLGNKWWEAKVLEIDPSCSEVLVHFIGWNGRHDEWIRMDSPRLQPSSRKTRRSSNIGGEKLGSPIPSSSPVKDFRPGEEVMALWKKTKYPANIIKYESDGTYLIEYYDGVKKKLRPQFIRKISTEDLPFIQGCKAELSALLVAGAPQLNGIKAEPAHSPETPDSGRRRKSKFNIKEIFNIQEKKPAELRDLHDQSKSTSASALGTDGGLSNDLLESNNRSDKIFDLETAEQCESETLTAAEDCKRLPVSIRGDGDVSARRIHDFKSPGEEGRGAPILQGGGDGRNSRIQPEAERRNFKLLDRISRQREDVEMELEKRRLREERNSSLDVSESALGLHCDIVPTGTPTTDHEESPYSQQAQSSKQQLVQSTKQQLVQSSKQQLVQSSKQLSQSSVQQLDQSSVQQLAHSPEQQMPQSPKQQLPQSLKQQTLHSSGEQLRQSSEQLHKLLNPDKPRQSMSLPSSISRDIKIDDNAFLGGSTKEDKGDGSVDKEEEEEEENGRECVDTGSEGTPSEKENLPSVNLMNKDSLVKTGNRIRKSSKDADSGNDLGKRSRKRKRFPDEDSAAGGDRKRPINGSVDLKILPDLNTSIAKSRPNRVIKARREGLPGFSSSNVLSPKKSKNFETGPTPSPVKDSTVSCPPPDPPSSPSPEPVLSDRSSLTSKPVASLPPPPSPAAPAANDRLAASAVDTSFPYLKFNFAVPPDQLFEQLAEGVNIPGPGRPIAIRWTRQPSGWTKMAYVRVKGLSMGKWDVYVKSPDGRSFKSKMELSRYFESNCLELSVDDFDFVLDPTLKKIRNIWKEKVKSSPTVLLPNNKVGGSIPYELMGVVPAATPRRPSQPTVNGLSVAVPEKTDNLKSLSQTKSHLSPSFPAVDPSTAVKSPANGSGGSPPGRVGGTSSSSLPGHTHGGGERGVRCNLSHCNKLFRNEKLLLQHVKHYHSHLTSILEEFLGNSPTVTDMAYLRTRVGDNCRDFETDGALLEILKKAERKYDRQQSKLRPAKSTPNRLSQTPVLRGVGTGSGERLKKRRSVVEERRGAAEERRSLTEERRSLTEERRNFTEESTEKKQKLLPPVLLDKTETSAEPVSSPLPSPATPTPSTSIPSEPLRTKGTADLTTKQKGTSDAILHKLKGTEDISSAAPRGDTLLSTPQEVGDTPPAKTKWTGDTPVSKPGEFALQATPVRSMNKKLKSRPKRLSTQEAMQTETSIVDEAVVPVLEEAVLASDSSKTASTVSIPPTWKRRPLKTKSEEGVETMSEEELVMCQCRNTEANGLMIQCDLCLTWQHGFCLENFVEDQVPEKYICWTCEHPRLARQSSHYRIPQFWGGGLPSLPSPSHATPTPEAERRVEQLSVLMSELSGLASVLHSVQLKLEVAEQAGHPKVFMWSAAWEEEEPPPTAATSAALPWDSVGFLNQDFNLDIAGDFVQEPEELSELSEQQAQSRSNRTRTVTFSEDRVGYSEQEPGFSEVRKEGECVKEEVGAPLPAKSILRGSTGGNSGAPILLKGQPEVDPTDVEMSVPDKPPSSHGFDEEFGEDHHMESTGSEDFGKTDEFSFFDFPSLNEVKELLPGVLKDISGLVIPPPPPANLIPEPKLINREESRLNLISHVEHMQALIEDRLNAVELNLATAEKDMLCGGEAAAGSKNVSSVLDCNQINRGLHRLLQDLRSIKKASFMLPEKI